MRRARFVQPRTGRGQARAAGWLVGNDRCVDESARAEQDAAFASARLAIGDAVAAWRAAGGYWPPGGQPSHRELFAAVEKAESDRDSLAKQGEPPSGTMLVARLREGRRGAVEEAIGWLEDDPFTLHTGYLKQKVMRCLCQVELSEQDRDRLRGAMLAVCRRGRRQEFEDARRLARRQLASRGFVEQLGQLEAEGADETTRQAARSMRLAVESVR